MTYKLLQIGPNNRGYCWNFHPGSLFISLSLKVSKYELVVLILIMKKV